MEMPRLLGARRMDQNFEDSVREGERVEGRVVLGMGWMLCYDRGGMV